MQTKGGIFLHQRKYATDVLKRFNMAGCNPTTTPVEGNLKLVEDESEKPVDQTLYRQIVGSLRYLCHSKPDIAYGVGVINRFMHDPRSSHMAAAKRIIRYVKGTANYGLFFPNSATSERGELVGFTDSDWCGDKTDRKSTSGYFFMLGKAPISWSSKKQTVVALSSCEAEYIAAAQGACQAVWLEALLEEIQMKSEGPISLMVDNKSAISLAKNPVAHGCSKHIETKFHFLRDQVSKGKIELHHCRTEDQLADPLSKPLKIDRFQKLRELMGVLSLENLN